jgi:hypothetical protein
MNKVWKGLKALGMMMTRMVMIKGRMMMTVMIYLKVWRLTKGKTSKLLR